MHKHRPPPPPTLSFGGSSKPNKPSKSKSTISSSTTSTTKHSRTPTTVPSCESSPQDLVILSSSELQYIKGHATPLLTAGELQQEQETHDKLYQAKKTAAKLRKEKMLLLAEDARASLQRQQLDSMLDPESQERDARVRAMAREKRDDELDMVKYFKGLAAEAEAFTLRDKQLADQAQLKAKQKEYEDAVERLMQATREAEEASRAAAEAEKNEHRGHVREALDAQIKIRQHQRLLEEEAREQERLAMVALTAKYKEEEALAERKRQEEMAQMRKEVLLANLKTVEARHLAKEKEKQELAEMLAYQAKKAAELEEREKAEAVREAAKKARQAELFASQERMMTNQEEMENLRIHRAAQQKERATRMQEQQDSQRRRQEQIALKEELLHQAKQKKEKEQAEAASQEAELEQTWQHSLRIIEREATEQAKKERSNKEHLAKLKEQVLDAEERRKQARARKWEEGKALKIAAAAEIAHLEAVRGKLLQEIRERGVDEKYLSSLRLRKVV